MYFIYYYYYSRNTTIFTLFTMSSSTSLLPTKSKTKTHKKLNELQLEVLHILYKFRFATAELISTYQEQSKQYTNIRLSILIEQEFVGKHYDSTYRLNHRSATYFLLPNGVRLLKANPELDHKGLHLGYYSRRAEPTFISRSLRLFRVYLALDTLYGSNLEFYTSTELAEQTNFPKIRPDGYMSFRGAYKTAPNVMLELMESTKPMDQIRQRLNRYLYHHETSTTWGDDYPYIFLICDNVDLERELQKHVARTLTYRGMNKPYYYTTTLRALYGSKSGNAPIWSSVLDPEKAVGLLDIHPQGN
jgi:hypothetical protein